MIIFSVLTKRGFCRSVLLKRDKSREMFIMSPSLIIESKAACSSVTDSGRLPRMASRHLLIVSNEVLNMTASLNCLKRVVYTII